MACLCKKQQCTIDRRGFRQELDSWRHKLIHCVGFESILEGLIDPELVEDLKLFKDLKPVAVSDWSFDENCLFCCLRRDKVKEHLIGLNKEGLEDAPKPLLVKDQITIIRLEKQAEEFLNAVLCRKDVPGFSDPHIPVVAREILQKMISQFAAEYTSKTSPPQDSCSDSLPHTDQSLPAPPLLSGASPPPPPPPTSPAPILAGPAHNQNPVLSKLLMADQDAPLDLTIKKPMAEASEQEGVLDLSIKKNRYSSSSTSSNLPVHSPCLSPATSSLKGESPELRVTKAKDLRSTSTLEQFMAKLCPHHQRQIVDAIGFLQMEVKAHASSNTQKDPNSTSDSNAVTPEKSHPELSIPSQSTSRAGVQDISHSVPSSCAIKRIPENAVSLKTSATTGPGLDLRSLGTNESLASPTATLVDQENYHSDHAPLKMKIMTSNAAGKKLSCVLNSTLSCTTLEDKQGNSNSSSRAETHSARLSSSVKKHSQTSLALQAKQREALGYAKDTPAKVFPVHMTIPPDSARTARKTIRGSSDHRMRDSACRPGIDADLDHCDIVFIDKPITECFKEQRRRVHPRRNARKSTRGHMYADEIWELKTVRTLAGRGNCPNPMPELITLVTPKQILSKPEGVPPVDMPFAGACRETMNQQMPTEETDESVIPGADVVEVAASKVDVVVETSQTDQCQSKGQSSPPSPLICSVENKETVLNAEQEAGAEAEMMTESEEGAGKPSFEAVKESEPEPQEVTHDRTEPTLAETDVEQLANITTEEAENQLQSDKLLTSEPVHQQNSSPSAVSQVEEEKEEDKGEKMKDEQPQEPRPQELQLETQKDYDNSDVTGKAIATGSAEELVVKDAEMKTPEAVDNIGPLEKEENNECGLSSTSLDALLKKLPPWPRKKGTKIPLPKRLRRTEGSIVGYVNGRPVSASDRNLRHRAGSNPTSPRKTPVKSGQNMPNDSSVDSTLEPNVENQESEKPSPETHEPETMLETTPVIEQEAEPPSDVSSSPVSKFPAKLEIHKQKSVPKGQDSLPVPPDQPSGHPQSTESKRQLRSTSQKPFVTPTLNILTSISSPESSTLILPPAEQRTQLILPLPLHVSSSSPIGSSKPRASDLSQLSTAPETLELNIGNAEPAEVTTEDVQKNEVEGALKTKQKLRSAKAVSEDGKSEKRQLSGDVSNPAENLSNIKTEAQSMPLRSKRVLRKDADASDVALIPKRNVASLEDRSASGDDGSSSTTDRPTRMPLRSETSKAEMSQQAATQSSPATNKKLSLRSQKSSAPATSVHTETARPNDVASPVRVMPERILKAQVKPPPLSVTSVPHSSHFPIVTPKHEPPKQTPNKFFQTLTGEESQQLITNLNIKFDKMQKGWVQMDKDGQPAAKYKNKSDRQAAIWKSKRRARKPKSSEQQKYSPVQMLFMKGFNLTSICRWFLESTETKSLVIVKKVNTRLPSETQLCFHSSSNMPGTSQGVFPSLQAERLKKHLKKFAIASPVKSNPKSQKIIAKALEQEANAVKGKEKAEPSGNTQTLTKSYSSAKASAQVNESPKTSGKSKNPASARILRKYSNIRGKMQVQQTTVRLKRATKMLKNKRIQTLAAAKSAAKANLKRSLKGRKSPVALGKRIKGSSKLERRKLLAGKKSKKLSVQGKAVKAQASGRASRYPTKRELPKRFSRRLGSPKVSEHNPAAASKSKVNNKKVSEADKAEVEKNTLNKVNPAKIQTRESSLSTAAEVKGNENAAETPQQSVDAKVPASPDQVLTRSQRKMEAAVPSSGSPSNASKRAAKSSTSQAASPKSLKKGHEPALTRSGASKRHQAALLPRGAAKGTTKRARELLETPAKRTRTK